MAGGAHTNRHNLAKFEGSALAAGEVGLMVVEHVGELILGATLTDLLGSSGSSLCRKHKNVESPGQDRDCNQGKHNGRPVLDRCWICWVSTSTPPTTPLHEAG